jgi:twitching motility protein PilT
MVSVNQKIEIKPPEKLKDIEKLFVAAAKNNASDVHLKTGQKALLRVSKNLYEIGNKVLTPEDTKRLIYEIMTPQQINTFETEKDIDFAYTLQGVGRFRINVFYDRGCVTVSVRRVNPVIPTFEELHLPPSLKKIAELQEGLVLVTGPTGCGKSTTLACLIETINITRKCHIITIEDPIEYLLTDKKSYISQREVGIDVESFPKALKHVVRQDPDVILIGELRDPESFEAGMLAAQTGHLVFGTVHSTGIAHTISRVLELFPEERHFMIRQNFSFNVKAIVCQRLVPSCKKGVKVVPAVEIYFANPVGQKIIQAGEDKKLLELIRASSSEGMQDFNTSLLHLIKEKYITPATGLKYSPNPEQLKLNLKGIFLTDDHKLL